MWNVIQGIYPEIPIITEAVYAQVQGSVSERRATRRDATNADADADANEASGGADAAADGGETRAVARRSERAFGRRRLEPNRGVIKPRTTTAAT